MSSLQQRSRNRNHTSGTGTTTTAASSSRSSNRQTKATNHGFYFGESQAAERDLEKIEREQARDRKRKEQRLEELEVRRRRYCCMIRLSVLIGLFLWHAARKCTIVFLE